MENNEIMQRLLQDDKQQNSNTKNEIPVVRSNGDKEIPMSRIRVVTAKYKVYIILLVIFICLLLLIYIPNAKDSLNSIRSSYQQANSQLDLLKNDIRIAEEDMVFLCDETNGVIKNEQELKDTAEKYLNNWRLERLGLTDQAIIEIAIYELLYTDTPEKVVIDEAIELAHDFSDEKVVGMINGVLDKVYHNKG